MTANMQGLKQAAESGSFAISKAGAEAYLKAIDDAQKELRQLDRHTFVLSNDTKLGTSPDAQAMTRYNAESVNGGGGTTGIIPAINQLKAALEEARQALQKAIENYREVDDAKANTFKRH
ncbi:chaperonin cofactor prefoldin [Saccharothrix tamanrassetensis]|uniref:Chaperonin cofactor prefoldin n=1 Tax=Saccharothrix tamanrassetensis TaxID=1051531 RepID=A0A841CE38_9PSEU|nr:hypothetical protein [Saccharothrix tamanrassetensis]MBB5954624.1 chaperonin cofactor prefoldin [Saccharothrix tamanrassetensis]